MNTLEKYFAREIIRSVLFVLLAFVALLAFFDIVNEVKSVGVGGYTIFNALYYVALGTPGNVYEYMPLAALIGTIFVMAQFAQRSEFTIMRVSGFSTQQAITMLLKIGAIFVVLTFIFGEIFAPYTFKMAEKYKISVMPSAHKQDFQSGLWTKDLIRSQGLTGGVIGSRFLNVNVVDLGGKLVGITYYDLDLQFRLTKQVKAESASYQGGSVWRLNHVEETYFPESLNDSEMTPVVVKELPTLDLISEITPAILLASSADNDTDRMSAYDLALYSKHLLDNKQSAEKFEIAFWKKIIYPFAVFVMMALALPFAFLHFRSGGVSLKIFAGIMIGVVFYLLNNVFAHIGLLHTWPPFVTAVLPSLLFLGAAMAALWWVENT
ncbi:LPS export ABC transporter permease LptG [Sapientia aquatica]|uniref:LPS export ABC transporter permease LptG n=1 Tax=Sapientia aquatica TaxID=1549640 RepID=A0A4R5W6B3_9BURK|nr:LPS export ABC transporter permease LptG [Sapientia aquatica]TDK67626.1 LPS export ABC transporter permease LptG [Sapientia aquatica]